MNWLSDGRRLLAVAIIFATLIAAWMFRYETLGQNGVTHRNRLTGVVCLVRDECWFADRYK
jgi:hypothetical protein